MTPFKTIRARAEKRKGGPKALARLLPAKPDPKALAKLGDDRILAEMTRRVFSAGFAWSVIETKWPGFEKAFLGFKPGPLTLQPDDFWDALMKDTRIVRNGAKIMSVRANAGFVRDIAGEHGSFGKFLAKWPSSDEAGLLELLSKRGSRLGGNTGQMMLRFLGWDGFVTSRDVVSVPARRRARYRGDRHLEARSRQGAGAVQRLGRGDRSALRADLADLRDVDRRELRGREAGEHGRRGRLIRLRSSSYGATSRSKSNDEESMRRVAAELVDQTVFPVEIGLHRAFLDIGAFVGTAVAV